MTYIKGIWNQKILSLSKEYSAILITGPRQVGKNYYFAPISAKNRAYVTLDDLEDRAMAQMILRFSFNCMTVQFLLTKFSMLHSFFHILRSKLTMVPNPAVSGLQDPSHSI